MSNTQDKRARRLREHAAFMYARRTMQVNAFEQNFETALRLYEEGKPILTEDQVELLEAQIKENRALIDHIRAEAEEWRVQSEN